MKPIKFKESNVTLTKPKNMTDEECESLPVYRDGMICWSLWMADWRERISILLFGKVWIGVHSGKTQPPITLWGIKDIFDL